MVVGTLMAAALVVAAFFAPRASTATGSCSSPADPAAPAGPSPSAAAPHGGDLDPTFGKGGIVTTKMQYWIRPVGIVAQPDGKVVAAGTEETPASPCGLHGKAWLVIVRYQPSGALDPGFGQNGVQTIDFQQNSYDFASAIAIGSDGKLVVAGTTNGYGAPNVIVRLAPNGALDPSFGNGGRVVLPFSDTVQSLAIDSENRIVGATHLWNVFRLRVSGSLDLSFGQGGLAPTFYPDSDSYPVADVVRIDAAGGIVVGGAWLTWAQHRQSVAVARYDSSGAFDPKFGAWGGKVVLPVVSGSAWDENAVDLAPAPGGKIVVLGKRLLRLDGRGRLDKAFGIRGRAAPPPALSAPFTPESLIAEGRGGFVAAGTRNGKGFALVRYGPRGSLSRAYGDGGSVVTDNPAPDFTVTGASRLPDGRLVVLGDDKQGRFVLTRYLAATCVVPSVVGERIAAAERSLALAGCALGEVRFVRSRASRRRIVVQEAPSAGTTLPSDGAVDLVVGRGRS